MWYTALKNLSKCFSTTLVSYEAALLDGLSKHYGYRSQEPRGVIRTVLQHTVILRCVYKDPKMAPVKRHAYKAAFKLKAISHAVEHGNRAAAREFSINESMVRKWRKQGDDLCQVKKT